MNKKYKNIVFLTGAGISAESGLATFRGANGLWNNHNVQEVASIEGYVKNPELVLNFYNELRPEILKAKPNHAHLAITELQKKYPAHISVITQNIDTLHEQAGNENVYHIHGQFDQYTCLNCGEIFHNLENITTQTPCPCCRVKGRLKPNIVFFGEMLLYMDKVEELLENCDLFISIGTSGTVFPAASFVQLAKRNGADTYEFTLEETSNNFYFDHHMIGKAGENLPVFIEELIKKA